MQHLSTAFLIIALVIVVNEGGSASVQNDLKLDQIAQETKTKKSALTLIDGPKYVAKPEPTLPPIKTNGHHHKPENRPPSKPPIYPDKAGPKFYVDIHRPYYSNIQQKLPPARPQYSQPLKIFPTPNSIYNFPKVIPLPPHKNQYYVKQQPRPVLFTSTNNKTFTIKSPTRFSIPVQTVNGIRGVESVKPPKFATTFTTAAPTLTTTKRLLRTKRIWPKRILEKMNSTLQNSNKTVNTITPTNSTDRKDHELASSITRIRYVFRNETSKPTRRPYRPVTRIPKIKSTTPAINRNVFESSDWIPIVPSHYTNVKRPSRSRFKRSVENSTSEITKRSDHVPETSPVGRRLLYLQSFGLIPVQKTEEESKAPEISRKKMTYFKSKRQLNPYYSSITHNPAISQYAYGDLMAEGSSYSHARHPKVVTKIKHHHHHHHHKYIKTVEKKVKVPFKVEVPKPYPVPVEKKVPVPVEKIKVVQKPVPYPVTVEKQVPYPIGIKIPHPVPYKVVEKQYVPKPYPVVQHVPVYQQVEVKVPVDRPVPYPVQVDKPYPVPVKVLVPQPYPVEKKVPYPVEVKVKEPVEVIKHVHVRVPYPQPFAVKVPHPVPVPVEKRVPYPVEVEKRVPVPVEVLVPQRVEVEKKVPVYIPKPYPVEKKVPYPVKVPVRVPVQVPVHVPVEVPIYVHGPVSNCEDYYANGGLPDNAVTGSPQHTVTVHGNTGFAGFYSRSDSESTTLSATIS